jgi:hypothetical protein
MNRPIWTDQCEDCGRRYVVSVQVYWYWYRHDLRHGLEWSRRCHGYEPTATMAVHIMPPHASCSPETGSGCDVVLIYIQKYSYITYMLPMKYIFRYHRWLHQKLPGTSEILNLAVNVFFYIIFILTDNG